MENPFSLKGKTTRQTPNNFIIIKSISIILMYVSQFLKKKKKSLLFFFTFTHTHTLIISFKGNNTLLSPPWLSSRRRQPFTLFFLLHSSQVKIYFLSLGFTLSFPSSHMEDPWAKTIKFFVALFIYKTLLLFPLGLGIHYFFNKKSIPF